MTDIIVLGAGPAGLAAALELAESGRRVTLIEREAHVGGNATSFNLAGVWVDYGSHRLHPASDQRVLERIRGLLGDDLLTRPRHGRIRLLGRWIHFPLRPADLALRLHPAFAFGVGVDLFRKVLPDSASTTDETFASILQKGLGSTICNEFYFPYARKIWGVEPKTLSPIQARKRVSSGSIGKMIKRLLPGGAGSGGANTKGVFYYPRQGFGQIFGDQAGAKAAGQAGRIPACHGKPRGYGKSARRSAGVFHYTGDDVDTAAGAGSAGGRRGGGARARVSRHGACLPGAGY